MNWGGKSVKLEVQDTIREEINGEIEKLIASLKRAVATKRGVEDEDW
jgi:hypothetical protein